MEDVADKAYADILAALDSVQWHLYKDKVTPIAPMGHKRLAFFPGQRGFSGLKFPVGGVMIVGNNFSNLTFWRDEYSPNLDYDGYSPTWSRLNKRILPATGIPRDNFWFTNFSLGVMDEPESTYTFPPCIREGLAFENVFRKCVDAMQPALIVALGEAPASYLDYVGKISHPKSNEQLWGGRPMIATLHPSARVSIERFEEEGHRIGHVYRRVRAGEVRSPKAEQNRHV